MYSLEEPHWGTFNEYPQHMFLWRTVENYPIIITKYSSLTIPLINTHHVREQRLRKAKTIPIVLTLSRSKQKKRSILFDQALQCCCFSLFRYLTVPSTNFLWHVKPSPPAPTPHRKSKEEQGRWEKCPNLWTCSKWGKNLSARNQWWPSKPSESFTTYFPTKTHVPLS